jgi:hypothetical protein
MPIDYAKVRNWSRKGHTEDDPALAIAWEAAKHEMELRTGWCVDPVTRTQYVPAEPNNDELLVRLERQPATAVTYSDADGAAGTATLVTINGIQYATMVDGLAYPVLLTVSAGTNTLNPLLEMALLQRTIQLEASRGDDTTTLPGDYWQRICAMMGKGIG